MKKDYEQFGRKIWAMLVDNDMVFDLTEDPEVLWRKLK